MHLGKVIGTVVSTSKHPSLVGHKLLIVSQLNAALAAIGTTEIAIDTVGAGSGEIVIVTNGSSARRGASRVETVVDAAIVGIVDSVEAVS